MFSSGHLTLQIVDINVHNCRISDKLEKSWMDACLRNMYLWINALISPPYTPKPSQPSNVFMHK